MGSYCKEPVYGARIRPEYLVLGHYKKLAIIGSANDELLYIEDENEVLRMGEYVESTGLKPVVSLSDADYMSILREYKG